MKRKMRRLMSERWRHVRCHVPVSSPIMARLAPTPSGSAHFQNEALSSPPSSSFLNCPTPPCSCNDLPWPSRAVPPWLRPSAAAWPPRPSVVSPPAPKIDSFHAKSRKPGRSCDTSGPQLKLGRVPRTRPQLTHVQLANRPSPSRRSPRDHDPQDQALPRYGHHPSRRLRHAAPMCRFGWDELRWAQQDGGRVDATHGMKLMVPNHRDQDDRRPDGPRRPPRRRPHRR